jgi:hypothetical protein
MKKSKSRSVGRPQESMAGDLKDLILRTYFEICWVDGVETVTLQKVADRSGVALTTVRYHFQLKGLSLSQVAQNYVSDKTYQYLDAGMLQARALPGYDPVLAYIDVMFSWLEQEPVQASFLVYYYYLCSTQVSVEIENKELVEIAQRRILSLVYEGVGRKLYSFTEDPIRLSAKIQMLVTGGCMIAVTAREKEFAQHQRMQCQTWVKELLGVQDLNTSTR